MKKSLTFALCAVFALGAACSKRTRASGASIRIDGSSTVFLISQAVAEQYGKTGGGRVTVGTSGTGGGFKKFCRGEIEIAGASRPIKPAEVEECKKAGIDYVELPVAYDGVAVVVHPKNDWAQHLTVAELKKMWEPEAAEKVTSWAHVRDGWPDKKLRLFGAGVDSGTYDYFTAAIVGKEHSSRGDFTSSEDDNVLVQGVSMDEGALGFFGYAYFAENKDKLKVVAIEDGKAENGDGPIAPSVETVATGTYQPLSRPIFIYVGLKAAENPAIATFVDYYLAESEALSAAVGYIPLPKTAYDLIKTRFAKRTTGTLFGGKGSMVGVAIESLLRGS